jgi:hypothetical protein
MGITSKQRGRHIFPSGDFGNFTDVPGDATLTGRSGILTLSKATPAAITLAAPVGVADGTLLEIRSKTAQAHVIRVTGGFGGAGSTADTVTFTPQIGAGFMAVAVGGVWHLRATNLVEGAGGGSGGGGGSFDQSLNTTDSPTFAEMTLGVAADDDGLLIAAPEVDLIIATPDSDGYVGTITVRGGAGSAGADGSSIYVRAGAATEEGGGEIQIVAGASDESRGGPIALVAGSSVSDDAGEINIHAGDSTDGTGGSITLQAGIGGGDPGQISLLSPGQVQISAQGEIDLSGSEDVFLTSVAGWMRIRSNQQIAMEGPVYVNQNFDIGGQPPGTFSPPNQGARLWTEHNTVTGKSRLLVQFPTGAPVQIAIEP